MILIFVFRVLDEQEKQKFPLVPDEIFSHHRRLKKNIHYLKDVNFS